jgi:hypothetical protein
VYDWDEARFGVEVASRYFGGTEWVVDRSDDEYNGDIVVEIWGTQAREGDVKRYVDILDEERREQMPLSSAAHVRQFGEALIAAADEIDQAASRDKTDNQLEQCGNCGRHGWHATDRCPERDNTMTTTLFGPSSALGGGPNRSSFRPTND